MCYRYSSQSLLYHIIKYLHEKITLLNVCIHSDFSLLVYVI